MILVHMCRTCGHIQKAHLADPARLMPQTRMAGMDCRCCLFDAPDLDPEPTPVETYRLGGADDGFYEPGSVRNAGTASAEKLCGCLNCRTAAAAFQEVPF